MPPNLANDVCQIGSSPLAPPPIFPVGKVVIWRVNAANISSVWLFIWIKKWNTENFKLKRIAVKFSANIIWLLVYLFAGSSRLRGRRVTGSSRAPTPTKYTKFPFAGRRQHCGVNAAASRRPLQGCGKFFALSVYSQTK